ncbi:MAG TPA: 2-amino-4-hydroxy-6-hydroxymethyldihydropteridine diphosphokinase [Rhodanobacteraceae bacterium]
MGASVAYIGIGSNLDDPEQRVRDAIAALSRLPRSRLVRASRLFRTPPWGNLTQPDFVNAAAMLETELAPRELLDALLDIECAAGRYRDGARWGPRRIDLDILLYGDRLVAEADLKIPHPHIAERAFVLLPLLDLDEYLSVPGQGRVADLLARLDAAGCTPIAGTTRAP